LRRVRFRGYLPPQASEGVNAEMDREFTIELQPLGRRIRAGAGQSVLATAQSVGVELQAVCGGVGTCGQCKVRCVSGNLTEPTLEEFEQLGEAGIRVGSRLACQAVPLSDVQMEIPAESLTSLQRVQIEGGGQCVPVDPVLPLQELVSRRPILGLAIDLGTTKLAGYLVDLESGRTIAASGRMNPQIVYGEDVISRIAFANKGEDGRRQLREKVIEALNALATELCIEAHISVDHIFEAVIAGNTAMHHFFLGLPVGQLGTAPYLPATVEPLYQSAEGLGLRLAPNAKVYTPPNIAGYVGGDHVAMLLGIDLNRRPQPTLMIDIGTNTELTLCADGRLFSCSCASGPAFEGAHIQQGMRAAPGAIERVRFEAGEIQYYTIDRQPPTGICGSGILDAIAALLDANLLDERGNFRKQASGLHAGKHDNEFVLAGPEQTESGSSIVLTRQDISEIQFAKAAIRAGIEVLLKLANLAGESLQSIVIAGAFGSYLDMRSAVRVGLFPDIPLERFRQVGNAAGLGARFVLASSTARREAEQIVERIQYVELTNHPAFHEQFVKALSF